MTSGGSFLCGLRKEKFREIKKLSQIPLVVIRTGMSTQVSQIQILSKEGETEGIYSPGLLFLEDQEPSPLTESNTRTCSGPGQLTASQQQEARHPIFNTVCPPWRVTDAPPHPLPMEHGPHPGQDDLYRCGVAKVHPGLGPCFYRD